MLEGLEDVMKDVKRSTKVDASAAVEEYINKEDWRINANANTGYSHAGLVNNLAGKMVANFWLDSVYTKKEGDAHRNGDYHIHDLDILAPYCFTKDTKIKTIEYGIISIEELLDKNVDEFTVYTTFLTENDKIKLEIEEDIRPRKGININNVNFGTRKAKNLRKTRENANLVEVEFGGSHGYKVRCTPDHKFLTTYMATDAYSYQPFRYFKWVEAKDLMPAMFLNNTGYDGKPHSNLTDVVCADGTAAWVKSVTPLNETEDVYCMEVEETHCFALENGVIAHNCCGHDLARLLDEGFNGVVSRVDSKAPKHLREALYQMANFIGILQAEWAGAQAFSSFDTYLAPLVFFDIHFARVTYDDIKKAVRNFVYNLNVPSRWGQSPFSNITIDIQCPKDLEDRNPLRNGKPFFVDVYEEYFNNDKLKDMNNNIKWASLSSALINRIKEVDPEAIKALDGLEGHDLFMTLGYMATYKYFKPEMHLIDKAYYEVMNEGDANGGPFTFPIPTVNITEDFDWDSEIAELIFENAAKYGSSYFQNFVGSQYKKNPETGKLEVDPNAYKPSDVRSMCCRLQLDKTQIRKKLEKRGGGLFGSDAQTGSVGVVTINMARLGYNFKGNIKGLYKQLFKLMDMAKSTLEKKRKFVVSMNERGLYPYTHRYVRTLDTFFSTIGVNGINEMIRNFTNDEYDITDERGQKMAIEVLDAIRERLIKYQEETGNMYNLEATPAEGTTYRLAREDAKCYPKRTVTYINCPVHGKVEVTTEEEEVECPLCQKEASKK